MHSLYFKNCLTFTLLFNFKFDSTLWFLLQYDTRHKLVTSAQTVKSTKLKVRFCLAIFRGFKYPVQVRHSQGICGSRGLVGIISVRRKMRKIQCSGSFS